MVSLDELSHVALAGCMSLVCALHNFLLSQLWHVILFRNGSKMQWFELERVRYHFIQLTLPQCPSVLSNVDLIACAWDLWKSIPLLHATVYPGIYRPLWATPTAHRMS